MTPAAGQPIAPGPAWGVAILREQRLRHPLPWHIESDWTEEVIASDGYCIAKCMSEDEAKAVIAAAEQIK